MNRKPVGRLARLIDEVRFHATAAGLTAASARLWRFSRHGSAGQAREFRLLLGSRPEADSALILERALDLSQPALRRVVELARAGRPDRAVEELRAHHRCLPARVYLRNSVGDLARAPGAAEAVLRGECLITGFPPFRLESSIDWGADPYRNRSWRIQLHSWSFLDPVLVEHEQSKKPRYADVARKIVLDWVSGNARPGPSNDRAWDGMAVARRAGKLAPILDHALREPAVPDGEILQLLRACRLHSLELSDPHKLERHNNHGIHELASLLALAVTIPELRDASTLRTYASRGLLHLLGRHFSPDGVHLEHSPGYHAALLNLVGLLRDTGWVEDEGALDDLFRKASRCMVWLIHPNGTLVRLGDTDQIQATHAVREVAEPELAFVLTQGSAGRKPQRCWAVFPRVGYASFRGPWDHSPWKEASFLFFAAAFHSRAHKHADDFTFEWSERGTVLLVDSGRFAYLPDDPRRRYVVSTRAHNTVEIDGRDYSRSSPDAFGSALRCWGESGGCYFIDAEVDRSRLLQTKHRRVLVYRPGAWLVVLDRLISPASHAFTQWFHFAPTLEMADDGDRMTGQVPGARDTLVVLPLPTGSPLRQELVKGQEHPRLQGWLGLRRYSLVPNYAAGYTAEGNDVTFATLLWLGNTSPGRRPEPGAAKVSRNMVEVHWRDGAGEDGFVFQRDGDRGDLFMTRRGCGPAGG
jgi:hypothetical protein